jgi:hypothetical protein
MTQTKRRKEKRVKDQRVMKRKNRNEIGVNLTVNMTLTKRIGEKGKQESPSWKVLIEKARMMKTSMNTWRGCSRVMGDIRDFQVSKGDHLHRKNIFYIIG